MNLYALSILTRLFVIKKAPPNTVNEVGIWWGYYIAISSQMSDQVNNQHSHQSNRRECKIFCVNE